MKTERRFLTADIAEVRQADADQGGGDIVGYAGVYYNGTPDTEFQLSDDTVERIFPGAFDETVKNDEITGLFNHEPNLILGSTRSGTLQLSLDERGLQYRARSADTSIFRDVREHIRRGDIVGSSFSFHVPPGGERWVRDGGKIVRELRKVTIRDVGPGLWAAYRGTTAEARTQPDLGDALQRRDEFLEHRRKELALEKRQALQKLGLADERTTSRIDALVAKQEKRGVIKGTAERVEARRCASQHFGLWCVQPTWIEEAISRIKAGLLQPTRVQQLEGEEDDGSLDSGEEAGLYTVDESGVATIFIDDQITKRGSSFGGTSSLRTRRALRVAVASDKVKSILLEIDSPGGTVAGTDDLAQEVRRSAKQKPVHAHISDLGASAAYWVASQAQRLTASRTSEIGSIGTVALVRDYSGAYEKNGIKLHVVSTGKHKGSFAQGSVVTEEHLEALQEEVDDLNAFFVRSVARGRNRSIGDVRSWADGRIWIADKALGMGLIDAIEDEDTARDAAGKAGVEWAEARRAARERQMRAEQVEEESQVEEEPVAIEES